MIPEKYRILMNNELDGINTPAERAELEAYFADHPAARGYLADLAGSLTALDDICEVGPPAALHGRIMRAVKKKKRAGRASWQDIVFGRLRMGYAFSAVVGVMVGFLLHTMIPVDSLGRDLTPLELFRGSSTTAMVADWAPAEPLEFSADGLQGLIRSYRLEDKILVRLNLRADRKAALDFRFDDAAQLQGIHFAANDGFQTVSADGSLGFVGVGTIQCEFLIDGSQRPGLDIDFDAGPGAGGLFRRKISWD